MSLEDIEKELYGQKTPINTDHTQINADKKDISDNQRASALVKNPWRSEERDVLDSEPVQKAEKVGSRVFIGLTVVLVALIGFAGYYLYQYFTTKDARFALQAPEEVRVGEPFMLQATFENVSKKTLFAPSVSVQLPQNAVLADDPNRRVIEERLPDVQAGESVRREYRVLITGTSYQTYQFSGEALFQYGESTLSSKFQKEASVSVIARNPVVSVDISLPESVMSGQEFEIEARYKNETDAVVRGILLQFDLPGTFSFSNSDPKLNEKYELELEELGAREEGSIIISGFLAEQAHAFVPFGVHAKIMNNSSAYEVSVKTNSVSVAASPLEVLLSSNASQNVAYPGDRVKFSLRVQNGAPVPLNNLAVRVQFNSDYFDLSSLQGSGSLQDASRSYVWNSSRAENLRELQPGQATELQFTVAIRNSYAPRGIPLTQAELQVLAIAESPTVPPGLTAQKTIGMESYALKLGGRLDMQQAAYYAEPGGEIENTGPMPPRVGAETTFTAHWRVVAQGTDMQQVRVRGALGSGMEWTGKVSVRNTDRVPQYNSQTGEIIWDVGDVQAGKPAPEAVFQLSFTPASNQGGQQYTLVEQVKLQGKDAFADRSISSELKNLDSRDFADGGALPQGYDKIRE
jgi:hypothetical protein